MWHTRRIAPGVRLQHQPAGKAQDVVVQLEEPHGVHLAKSRQMPMPRWSARRVPGGEGRRKRHGRVRSLRTAGESGWNIYIYSAIRQVSWFHGFPFVVGFAALKGIMLWGVLDFTASVLLLVREYFGAGRFGPPSWAVAPTLTTITKGGTPASGSATRTRVSCWVFLRWPCGLFARSRARRRVGGAGDPAARLTRETTSQSVVGSAVAWLGETVAMTLPLSAYRDGYGPGPGRRATTRCGIRRGVAPHVLLPNLLTPTPHSWSCTSPTLPLRVPTALVHPPPALPSRPQSRAECAP